MILKKFPDLKMVVMIILMVQSNYLQAQIVPPTLPSTDLQFTNIDLKSLTLQWTPGDGERRIIIGSLGSAIGRSPANGQTYTANPEWGQGQNLGQYNFVVYDGTGSSVTITGLTNSTQYTFRITEYNGYGETSSFLLNPNLTASQYTGGAEIPTTPSSDLQFTNVDLKSLTLQWTPGDGERRIIIGSLGSKIGRSLGNGHTYTANPEWGLGQNLGQNNFIVYDGTGSSVTITGLTNSTQYTFRITEYNGYGETSSFLLNPNLTASQYTAGAEMPATPSTDLQFKYIGANNLTLQWTPGDGERRVIIGSLGSAIGRSLGNGHTYTADPEWGLGQNLGQNNFIVYDGTGSSVTITGLTNSTQYTFRITEYNGFGETSCFLLTPNLTASQFTIESTLPTDLCSNVIFCDDGNVGIGTGDTKGNKLAVAGEMIAEKVVIKQQSNWPDYVFDTQHALADLTDIETYINKYRHLPDIPNESEISENGYDLAEMDKLLLKKLEELTLYLINQHDEIKSIKNEISELKEKRDLK